MDNNVVINDILDVTPLELCYYLLAKRDCKISFNLILKVVFNVQIYMLLLNFKVFVFA